MCCTVPYGSTQILRTYFLLGFPSSRPLGRDLAQRAWAAFRSASLTHSGRSAIIVIGTQNPGSGDLLLTVTAATVKPFQLRFDRVPDGQTLREAIFSTIPEADYFNDVHGSALYKRHLTYYLSEQIRAELLGGAET